MFQKKKQKLEKSHEKKRLCHLFKCEIKQLKVRKKGDLILIKNAHGQQNPTRFLISAVSYLMKSSAAFCDESTLLGHNMVCFNA